MRAGGGCFERKGEGEEEGEKGVPSYPLRDRRMALTSSSGAWVGGSDGENAALPIATAPRYSRMYLRDGSQTLRWLSNSAHRTAGSSPSRQRWRKSSSSRQVMYGLSPAVIFPSRLDGPRRSREFSPRVPVPGQLRCGALTSRL